jgi:DNA-binding transcriptional MerR regulator
MEPRVTIGRAARATGVPAKTIRYYEQKRVLPAPARGASGYRLYDRQGIERLRFIRQVRSLGLPLDQLTSLTGVLDGGPRRRLRPRLRALVGKQLDSVKNRIAELEVLRGQLEQILQRMRTPGVRRSGETCRCLEPARSEAPGPGREGHRARRSDASR